MFGVLFKKIIHYLMPLPVCRSDAEQAKIDTQTQHLKLYPFFRLSLLYAGT